MKAWKNVLVVMLVVVLAFGMTSCSKDDNNDNSTGPSTQTMEQMMVGTWLSAGANVAPLLVGFYQTDTVRVTFTESTIVTKEHRADSTGGHWEADQVGTFTLGEAPVDGIYGITIDYTEAAAYQQQGIVKLIEATPDTMKLEVVLPNLATPRTPQDGFGSDPSLGTSNIQVYVRQ